MPAKIRHDSHPHHLLHLLSTVLRRMDKDYCRMCVSRFGYGMKNSFSCELCHFHLHPECALLLPDTIRLKYDKHPMTLCYRPIENHEGDYFCEVCEEEFNPNSSFYNCHECVQSKSIHVACAPLIPPNKACVLYDSRVKGAFSDYDLSIKFGGVHKTNDHPHPLSILKGTRSDGKCTKCDCILEDYIILKCLQCKFAIDIYCSTAYGK
ncbi:putative chromatin regulator PHD family [Helianthus annuus]|nr:putative chromatin regulator PHD family [Helianthus annuus]